MRAFQQYMVSDGWVWVGVFILVNLMQGHDSPVYQYFHEIGLKYFF
jgi:hypothetical protein